MPKGCAASRFALLLCSRVNGARSAIHPCSASISEASGAIKVVGLGRFELPTSPLSGVRSNQLSYRPSDGSLVAAGSRGLKAKSLGALKPGSLERFSRTQLNVRHSYAMTDHRC